MNTRLTFNTEMRDLYPINDGYFILLKFAAPFKSIDRTVPETRRIA